MLWVPLFENSENSEETTRNVAAACLGKLATTHPAKYLPQLHVSFVCRCWMRELRFLFYFIHRLESKTPNLQPELLLWLQSDIRLQRMCSLMMSCYHL
jgi:hypothetical protein